jgi:aspartate dehydrogenase
MKSRVGIIGCGTIGRYVAERVEQDPDLALAFVIEPDQRRAEGLERFLVSSYAEAAGKPVDLVVEAATPTVAREAAPEVLKFADLMVFSLSAFREDSFREAVAALCQQYKRRVYVPHGAILGIDGITDGREVIDSVEITTIKKPKSYGRDDATRTELYGGPVRKACELYPRNVNVHAILALTGLGFDRTVSRIVSDPDAPGNSHLITVKGQGFRFAVEVFSESKGLVTGAYTPVSAFNSIKRVLVRPYGFTAA